MTFYGTFSDSLPNQTIFLKEIFDTIHGLQVNVMTALLVNERSTSTFYESLLNCLPNLTTFGNNFFYSMHGLERD